MIVGLDGCKGGWIAVMITDSGEWEVKLFLSIADVWNYYQDSFLILIDIPIGLKLGGTERRCDLEARKLLGKRHSSVFPVPCRGAIYTESYGEACAINEQQTGRRLSKQTWAITPKIREVDQFLLNHEKARINMREIHPEVCFWGLAGGRPMSYNKKKPSGANERQQTLRSIFPHTDSLIAQAFGNPNFRAKVGKDDILDAMSAAVTGLAFGKNLSSIPVVPEFDEYNLPMEMVFRMMQ
ncbi:MAG: DUF429 domain-containing protein [Desulfomonilaceae bacterium]